jgi:nucleotide-binding universal stress UspA family protein
MATTAKGKDGKSNAGASAKRAMQQRIFLVVVDETEEMRVALRYAALRARHTGGRVALLFVIEPSELKTWGAIEDLQRQESRASAEAALAKLSSEIDEISGSMPVVHIREGRRSDELLALLNEEPSISVLVLAAGTGPEGPGPLVTTLIGKMAGAVRVPVTVVPGNLTETQLAALA